MLLLGAESAQVLSSGLIATTVEKSVKLSVWIIGLFVRLLIVLLGDKPLCLMLSTVSSTDSN